MKIVLIILFSFLTTNTVYAEKINYFPKGTLSDESNRWYSEHLSLFSEPIIWSHAQDPQKRIYRFLLISIREDPLVVRLEINQEENSEVIITKLVRSNNLKAEYAKIQKLIRLDKHQTSNFLQIFNEDEFFAAEKKDVHIRFGGIAWVIEGVNEGRYHFIERWSEKSRDYPESVKYLLNFLNDKK